MSAPLGVWDSALQPLLLCVSQVKAVRDTAMLKWMRQPEARVVGATTTSHAGRLHTASEDGPLSIPES